MIIDNPLKLKGDKNSLYLYHYEFPMEWSPHFYPPDDLKLLNIKDIKEFKGIIGENNRFMKRFKILSNKEEGKVNKIY